MFNISKTVQVLLLSVCCIGINAYLFYRYYNWEINSERLYFFLLFATLAESLLIYSFFRFQQLINPVSFFSLYIYSFGYSLLKLSYKQTDYSGLFISLILVSIVSFLAGTFLCSRNFQIRGAGLFRLKPEWKFWIAIFCLIIGIVCFGLEMKQIGYIPLLAIGSSHEVYSEITDSQLGVIHYFVTLLAIVPVFFYIFYKQKRTGAFVAAAVTVICLFVQLNFFSRQFIVLLFLAYFLAVSYYHVVSFRIKVIVISSSVLLFVFLGAIRGSMGDYTLNDFLRAYAEIDYPTNVLETYFTLYSPMNFSTGNIIVNNSVHESFVGYGRYVFKPIISLSPLNKQNNLYPELYNSYKQLGTYIVELFLDFGYIGVSFFSFIYGFFSQNSFLNYSKKESPYYIVEWSVFAFSIFMFSFTNYFHVLFVWFFLFVNRMVLK